MSTNDSSLGRCPKCGTKITSAHLLIEYETADGDQAAFAECPECLAVVKTD